MNLTIQDCRCLLSMNYTFDNSPSTSCHKTQLNISDIQIPTVVTARHAEVVLACGIEFNFDSICNSGTPELTQDSDESTHNKIRRSIWERREPTDKSRNENAARLR